MKYLKLFSVLIILTIAMVAINATHDKQGFEQAILKKNWSNVHKILNTKLLCSKMKNRSELRIIKAHACLALNKNNESLIYFFSASSKKCLERYLKWANWFAKKHPTNSISYYFKADASARLEQWDYALNNFNEAIAKELKINSKEAGNYKVLALILEKNVRQMKKGKKKMLAMILNARGVVNTAQKNWDNAKLDFQLAIGVCPDFADSYVSQSTFAVLNRDVSKTTNLGFKQALKISPNFVLAHNGLACVNYGLGQWDKAKEEFNHAKELAKKEKNLVLEIITTKHLYSLTTANLDCIRKRIEIVKKENPGAPIRQRIHKFMAKTTQNLAIAAKGLSQTIAEFKPGKITIGTNGIQYSGTCKGFSNGLKSVGKNLEHASKGFSEFAKTSEKIGGISTEEIKRAYVDKGEWHVKTWFGVFYNVPSMTGRINNE